SICIVPVLSPFSAVSGEISSFIAFSFLRFSFRISGRVNGFRNWAFCRIFWRPLAVVWLSARAALGASFPLPCLVRLVCRHFFNFRFGSRIGTTDSGLGLFLSLLFNLPRKFLVQKFKVTVRLAQVLFPFEGLVLL